MISDKKGTFHVSLGPQTSKKVPSKSPHRLRPIYLPLYNPGARYSYVIVNRSIVSISMDPANQSARQNGLNLWHINIYRKTNTCGTTNST